MGSSDKRLGMDQAISRRDFLNGVGVAIGVSLLPGCSKSGDPVANVPYTYYPPAETGMRGSHPGSFEVAHAAVQGQRWTAEETGEHYDLVVVGAGISGLSAAYIYHRDVDPNARILILDNHDDFGGHAKRNEFTLDGRTFIGYGGTMLMDAPEMYPDVAREVIRELGVEYERYEEFEEGELIASLGLDRASFFDKETFGADYLATGSNGLDGAPLSASGKKELKRLLADQQDYLAGMTPAERQTVLESHSWREYLEKFGGFGEEVLTYAQQMTHAYWAMGADALPAWMALSAGYPGFAGSIPRDENESAIGDHNFRFPDGNASIARLLVRKLIPGVAPGNTMEDSITAHFDYSEVDQPENLTRIRLSSTVVDLRHRDGELDADLDVTYVSGDVGKSVTANKVIWAGYHAMLPYVCPDVPADQVAAQGESVRAPLVYINVLLRNWRSLAKLGLQRIYCPGGYFPAIMLTHQVSMGDYKFAQSPDEPVILHMQHIPLKPGLSAPDQFRAGRQELLETSFETFERNIRDQLGRILGPGGFDPARDIAGITVNRWSHGYAYSVDEESGDVAWVPEDWRHEDRPWIDARQSVGNIAIAGTDASSNAMTESAIEEAHRAVHSFKG
jgi:spermidine dehydrogenase